ncbi:MULTISPECIES: nucleotidyl transferase AbiEii/AbiGii toxin family protein [unclassified Coprococcus]|uniref:nucleotidyl transferase AbiEii/AbiGii toxin family protein n=1 Tax=unclassified Coprococcus TaxID=2684943 RepID=UPI0022E1BCEE|nr:MULTISPECIES: nucleotidyl transferase AbiEii/AbiGii toxin family protein [unclassified Coprococcus]
MWGYNENIPGGAGMTNATSVKDRLKKQAIENGKTVQDKLVTFGLERTIYRLSISEYAERFTLKGGIFLYALFEGEYARATMDIDLLAQRIQNDADEMKKIFHEIFSIECDDALRFDLNTLKVINITEFKEYHGVHVSIMGYLDRTRIPVSIDIGFGDVVYPERMKMEFPVLLDMEVPEIYAYSIYSVIAEKFEAFVSLGFANGRYKDFYDIYVLAERYDLNGMELKKAIIETFTHRGTEFDDIVAFEDGFTDDEIRQGRWRAFIKKKKAMLNVEFEETMQLLKDLLLPIVKSIRNENSFEQTWNKETKSWM